MPTSFDNEIAQGETVPYNAEPQTAQPEQDFDKTLAYDTPPPNFSEKQSDIKTEVFNADFSALDENADAAVPLVVSDNQTIEAKPELTETNLGLAKTSNEIETVSAGSKPTEVSSKAAGFSPKQDADIFEQNRQQYVQPPPGDVTPAYPVSQPIPSAEPERKAKSKTPVLIGWYFYKNSAVTTATPTPTPESTIEITPTPSPVLVETNSNTNSNTTVENPSNTNSQITNQQEIIKTETPGVTPKPSVQPSAVKPTPKKTDPSTAGTPKTTPAKTPKKGDRTDILQ